MFLLSVSTTFADTIILKGGRKLIGIIDPISSDDEQVTIRTTVGTLRVPRSKIQTIEQQENISYTESSGDLAMAENDLDRALDLYQKALRNQPSNTVLQKKIQGVREKIRDRDQRVYGRQFSEIEKSH